MRRGRKPMTAAERAARDAFELAVLERDGTCIRARTAGHTCIGCLDAHHAIPKQRLKTHTMTLPEAERLAIVWDPRIGVAVCREGLHGNLTTHADYLRLEELPSHVLEFTVEHRLGHALEREIPGLHVDDYEAAA